MSMEPISMSDILAPHEQVLGAPANRLPVLKELRELREHHTLYVQQIRPRTTYVPLSILLQESTLIDNSVFDCAIHELRTRHATLIPIPGDRTWVGVKSADPVWHGGFHQADHGYRHIQMIGLLS